MVATQPCDLLLSLCFRLSLFFDINVSQGSVATFVRCGGIFNYSFITNLLLSPLVKIFKNRLAFGEVMDKSIAMPFFSGEGVEIFTHINLLTLGVLVSLMGMVSYMTF